MRKTLRAALPVALGTTIVLAPATDSWAMSATALRLLGHDQRIRTSVGILAAERLPVVSNRGRLAVVTDDVVAKNDAIVLRPRRTGTSRPQTGVRGTARDRCSGSFQDGGNNFKGPYPLCPP